ncbi:MAG: thioesterase [Thalassospira sp.]|uniref:PaaI family thioesterase n=1 Tax=Thalassospira sp. TaxID=1912094 RepID=UPI000C5850D6|nr:PaaI family thioesterase [Thalassospira sp.]MAZ31630.1 thioesterase [Thalassospira sp.]|tara:strand:+ start:990 stop:1457 length:468 start_codon:yes stop_codon:yes gene_type:complete
MAQFEPQNPNYDVEVRHRFRQQPYNLSIGAEVIDVKPGRVEIVVPSRADLIQHNGYFHGGLIAGLADIAGGFAGWSLVDEDQGMLTIEYKLNIVAPGIGQELRAVGEVVSRGRSIIVTRIDVFGSKDGAPVLCATSLQTLKVMKLPPELLGDAAA